MKKLIIILLVISLIGCYINTQQTEIFIKAPKKNKITLIHYNCDNNKEISVSFTTINKEHTPKNIVIINSQDNKPIILSAKQVSSGFLYSNGKYTFRVKGNDVQWTIGRMMPMKCTEVDSQTKQKALI
jgi:membrane-bound inhibitor of C-type lysozyme